MVLTTGGDDKLRWIGDQLVGFGVHHHRSGGLYVGGKTTSNIRRGRSACSWRSWPGKARWSFMPRLIWHYGRPYIRILPDLALDGDGLVLRVRRILHTCFKINCHFSRMTISWLIPDFYFAIDRRQPNQMFRFSKIRIGNENTHSEGQIKGSWIGNNKIILQHQWQD